MYERLFAFLFMFTLSFSLMAQKTHAQDISAALSRIDAIIAEMQALRAEFVALTSTIGSTPATPLVLGAVSGNVLGDDIAFGSTNADIKKIQTLLATDPTLYPYGLATGYFGPKTQEAIRSFQARFGLDTVGIVGPSTRALFEVFFAAYPTENYPEGVLQKPVPTVAGASTTVAPTAVATTPTVAAVTALLKSISVTEDSDEYIVKSYKKNGVRNRDLILYSTNGNQLIAQIAKGLSVSEAEVRSFVDVTDFSFGSPASSGNDTGIDVITVTVSDGSALVFVEYDNGQTKKFTVREDAEDSIVDAIATKLDIDAGDVSDVMEIDYGSIDIILVEVGNSSSRVTVDFDSGVRTRFTVSETMEADIVTAIADEIHVRESEVERVLDFN